MESSELYGAIFNVKTQRTRVTNGLVKMPIRTGKQMAYSPTYPNGTNNYNESFDDGAYSGVYKDITDWSTPSYKVDVKKGAIVNSPCIIRRSEVSHNRGQLTGYQQVSSNSYNTFLVNDLPLARFLGLYTVGNSGFTDLRTTETSTGVVSMGLLRDRAILSAFSKVSPPEMQSLVTLSELNKTVQLIGSTAKKLADAIELIRSNKPDRAIARALGRPNVRRVPHPIRYTLYDERGNPILGSKFERKSGPKGLAKPPNPKSIYGHSPRKTDGSRTPIDDVSSKWLEWRYGWGPLVMDLVSALKALNKARIPRRFMVRGFANDESDSSVDSAYTISIGTTSFRKDVSHSRKVRAYVLYEVKEGYGALLNDFGVLDFPASAWELVPFSFVVDWFIPIGDWVSAITPRIGVNILAAGASMTEDLSVTRTVTGWAGSGTYKWDFSGLVGRKDSYSTRVYERETPVTVPLLPQPDVKIGIKRAVDAIALLSSRRSRK